MKQPPEIRLVLTDLELRERESLLSAGFESLNNPVGIEYQFDSFNCEGTQVCSGTIVHDPGRTVYVRYISTAEDHRRKGYASATVFSLIKHFHLPITPVSERGEGRAFWENLRKRFKYAGLICSEVSVTDLHQMSLSKPSLL